MIAQTMEDSDIQNEVFIVKVPFYIIFRYFLIEVLLAYKQRSPIVDVTR